MSEKSEYEQQREERIARNKEQLKTLNVPALVPEPSKVTPASLRHGKLGCASTEVKPKKSTIESRKRAPLLHLEPVR